MLNGDNYLMSKQIYALIYIDNVDGYSETQAVSFDESKLEKYCDKNGIELDSEDPQTHTIQLVPFIE